MREKTKDALLIFAMTMCFFGVMIIDDSLEDQKIQAQILDEAEQQEKEEMEEVKKIEMK